MGRLESQEFSVLNDFGQDSAMLGFGLRYAIFMERSGGVTAIVCDTTGNTVRQGYCYTCLAIGGVLRSGH